MFMKSGYVCVSKTFKKESLRIPISEMPVYKNIHILMYLSGFKKCILLDIRIYIYIFMCSF